MDGEHAESSALETNDLAGLANFLDTPEEESNEENDAETVDESTGDADTDDPTNAETDDDDIDPDNLDDDEEPAPERKLKVTVKGDDGTESILEVPETELVKGYQRQSDYTKKTQALVERESQAVQFLTTKHQEVQAKYLQQAELSRAAVAQMAGIRSEAEMAELANSDPAAWVAENQRQRQVNALLNTLDQQIQAEREQANAMQKQQQDQMLEKQYQTTWAKLEEQKIDKPALQKIFDTTMKSYGYTPEEMAKAYDHRLILMMKDAAAYQSLKSQKSEVTKKAESAPRLPTRQNNPQTTRDKAVEQRFKSGRAKLSDLASFLN